MEEFNPWWSGEEDRDMEMFRKLEYQHHPKWLDEISLKPFSVNFVFGLRKTGKTTGIKLLIQDILKKENPFSVFFFRVDILDNYQDLYQILKEYWKIKKKRRIKKCYIFLDEVTLLENWWRALKVFIDEYKPMDSVIVLSGSVSMFFHGKTETFGGRKGEGKLIEAMPLSFGEYFHLFGKPTLSEKVKEIFEIYLKTGGYLGVLNGTMKEEDIILSLKNDLRVADKSVIIGKEILSMIIEKAPSPYSYHSVARDLGISVRTVIEYMEKFMEMYVIKNVRYRGLDNKVYPRKERKFILRDPYLAKTLGIWCSKEIRKDFLYEWIVQEHLYRRFGEIYYYRNKYEIDCLAGNLKIEVKAGKPHRKYPKDVKILEEEDLPGFLLRL